MSCNCLRAFILFSTLLFPSVALSEPFTPSHPIEFVVMTGSGDSADRMARVLQKIIEDESLVSQPIRVSNLSGGFGAAAFQHMLTTPDPDHTLLFTVNTFFTTPLLQQGLGADILEFQPIARLAEDQLYLWVRADRPVDKLDALVEQAREKGEKWLMAGASAGGSESILTEYLNIVFGLEMSYRALGSGARATSALLHGRADSGLISASQVLALPDPRMLRALFSFESDDIGEVSGAAPTLIERGQAFSYAMQRAVVGAPTMSDDAAAYYTQLFEEVSEMPAWSKYRRSVGMSHAFLSGEPLLEFWRRERADHENMLRAIGRLP